ncbi:MFS transporter [Geodermatophilus sabuli]|uniref:MFS transporter, CP family, cyanate transporter n=1 Tax=Geodermatophilus sabuli TaxID=1564158 RepID=A0A285EKJ9_9ACTN|nr:MFS transporter [Geodermatophilus sabuli]MBB3087035.1 CP family cyanate transporter-like MFS transporter [Geodermatophilus sabuli]SNX99373.1 MFS transporter, CP family, cyanate transporter [Geodermatophilus sabuli]
MTTPTSQQARPVPRAGLLLLAVLLAGLNLRGAIAAVSPVLPDIRAELGLTPTVAGLITTLPVLCFAVLAPPAAWLGRRMGPERAVLAGLLAIAAGTALRVLDGAPVLLAGTFLVGAGMTAGNVLLPAVTKRDFAERAGTVTGLYTGALAAGAALTAALTAPVAVLIGWRWALASWALLALVAAAVWWAATRAPRTAHATTAAAVPTAGGVVWRSAIAWAVTTVLALQSVLYYAVTTWLPTLLVDEVGASLASAALAATLFQVLGIPGTLVVPAVLARRRPGAGQSGLGLAVAAVWAVLFAGLLVAPQAWALWAVVGGLAQGAGISLAFTLVVLRARDDASARRLSGMAQLVGYAVGAAGPLVVGAFYSASGGWGAPLALLLGGAGAYAVAVAVAGRPRTVG